MAILSAVIVPHPPLLIPQVGMGQEKLIQKTIDSYHEASRSIADLKPETVILISPHAVAYSDYIQMASGTKKKGSLAQFGDETLTEVFLDGEFTDEVCRLCENIDFPAGTLGKESKELDHGTLVPLYFLNQYYKDYRLVICSLSGLPREEQYRFGMLLHEAVENLGRRAVIIASGDLSHKLKESGPYSFAKEGPELDKQLTNIMKSGNFLEFLKIDENLCRLGSECGLGSFLVMAGILNKKSVVPRFLSYEGTFGVGYAICIFPVAGEDPNRDFYKIYVTEKESEIKQIREKEDVYVKLARETLEHYILTDRLRKIPDGLPDEISDNKAGTFVSIKKNGQLRGCIGTTEPTQENIALEIMYNAISAGTRDPRFSCVRKEEFLSLVYHVDILSPSKPVKKIEELNPERFGVIVTKGTKRGLLLPNLEGIDTVEEQIKIACQKAGIDIRETYNLECFEVVRHT